MFTKNKAAAAPRSARRRRGRPRGLTAQGEAQRRKLYTVATQLFARQGFEATTLRQIADGAGVSPALLYRYFPAKRAVVLAMYDELSRDFAREVAVLPQGRWRARFMVALRASLTVLGPHRETLAGLIPLLVSRSEESVLSSATAFSRERVEGAFVAAVVEASDAPKGDAARALGRILYLAHLGVLLWWLLDRSRGQRATTLLLAFAEKALAPVALALRLPATRRLLAEFDTAAEAALWGDEEASDAARSPHPAPQPAS
jgi:AcrR family transcriptional regulator